MRASYRQRSSTCHRVQAAPSKEGRIEESVQPFSKNRSHRSVFTLQLHRSHLFLTLLRGAVYTSPQKSTIHRVTINSLLRLCFHDHDRENKFNGDELFCNVRRKQTKLHDDFEITNLYTNALQITLHVTLHDTNGSRRSWTIQRGDDTKGLTHTHVSTILADVVGPKCAARVSALTSRKRLTLAPVRLGWGLEGFAEKHTVPFSPPRLTNANSNPRAPPPSSPRSLFRSISLSLLPRLAPCVHPHRSCWGRGWNKVVPEGWFGWSGLRRGKSTEKDGLIETMDGRRETGPM